MEQDGIAWLHSHCRHVLRAGSPVCEAAVLPRPWVFCARGFTVTNGDGVSFLPPARWVPQRRSRRGPWSGGIIRVRAGSFRKVDGRRDVGASPKCAKPVAEPHLAGVALGWETHHAIICADKLPLSSPRPNRVHLPDHVSRQMLMVG
jgi:hypothetical protein